MSKKIKVRPAMNEWRKKFKVHPAAEVFPMMSVEELKKLGEDIRANGLREPIKYWDQGGERLLIDGRNRLEAAELIGLELGEGIRIHGDPVAYIISANIRRRHLTKQQQTALIIAALKAGSAKPPQDEAVSQKGGRGKVNPLKQAAIAEAKKHDISESTVERELAKAEGRLPEPKKIAGPKLRTKPKLEKHLGLDAARRYYLDRCADPEVDLDAEQEIIIDELREIAGKRDQLRRALEHNLPDLPDFLDRKRSSTLPQDGRSEEPMGDPTPENAEATL